ncbi:MAG TPA: TetR/AcrR family transcriptional regulator [Acidimicrobiales bacterium]|nr:TetR/AcrR family transcriptional regulator [Acidimicrobiales bacterium]
MVQQAVAGQGRGAAQQPGARVLLPRAERRRAILAGAATAFAAAGFDGTSMEDIADAAGVSKLILYRHFDSKEELYRSILEAISGRLREESALVVGGERRRGAFHRAFVAVAREDPDGFRLLWRHSAHEPRFAGYASKVRGVAEAFARNGVAARLPDPGLHEWAASVVVAYLVESVLAWLDHGDPGGDERFADMGGLGLEAMIQSWTSSPGSGG